MMKINDMKYCLEELKPEGFEYKINGKAFLLSYDGIRNEYYVESFIDGNNCIYEIFLQKTIEAIIKKYGFQFDLYFNKKTNLWDMMYFNKLNINYPESKGLLQEKGYVSSDKKTPEEAKESAIIHIVAQLRLNLSFS